MIIPNTVKKKYEESLPLYCRVQEVVKSVLTSYSNENNYIFLDRIKNEDSLCEKIETGRYISWETIDDIYASTIVIPTLVEEDNVITYIKSVFDVVEVRSRGSSNKPPDVFRFDSTRLICKIKSNGLDIPISKLLFEVQIKSIFEFAWSTTTHSLTYKTNKPSWERLRLASNIKAMVEQVDMMLLGFEQSSKLILSSEDKRIDSIIEICEFTENIVLKLDKVPINIRPKDLNRFSENFYVMINSTKWYRNKRNKEDLSDSEVLDLIFTILEKNLIGMDHIPISISLMQLYIGILNQEDIIKNTLRKFYPLVTSELLSIFPKSRNIHNCFKI